MSFFIENHSDRPHVQRLHVERQQIMADMEVLRSEMTALKECMRLQQQRMRCLNAQMLRYKRTPLSIISSETKPQDHSKPKANLRCLQGGLDNEFSS